MAIVVERNITIKDDKSSLNRPIYFYVGDGDITCLFHIVELVKTAKFGSINVENIITEGMSYGEACIYKPNSELVSTVRLQIIDDVVRAVFSFEDMDEQVEAGKHLLQIHLFDTSSDRHNRLTIPPVDVNILVPICDGGNSYIPDTPDNPNPNPSPGGGNCGCDMTDYYTKDEVDEIIDRYHDGRQIVYVTKAEYDRLSDAEKNNPNIVYIIIDSEEEYATKQEVIDALATKAPAVHYHDDRYYTETEIDAMLKKIEGSGETPDLTDYYNKQQIDNALANKADKTHNHDDRYSKLNHTHSQYMDEDDLDAKLEAKDLATETWVKDQINNAQLGGGDGPEIDLSIYATKTELNNKADKNHTHDNRYYTESEIDAKLAALDKDHDHDEYITQDELDNALANIEVDPPDLSQYVTDSELDLALLGKADKTHLHDDRYSKLDHTHSNYANSNHNHDGIYSKVGHTHGNYADKNHTHSEYATTSSLSNYATKTYVDDAIDNIDLSGNTIIDGINTELDGINTELDGINTELNSKANINHIHNEYAMKKDTVLDTTLSMGRKENTNIGINSTALGSSVEASGDYSHAEGSGTIASGEDSHAEGCFTKVTGERSHAEGFGTIISGAANSHAEGHGSEINGFVDACHVEGFYTIGNGNYQHVQGKYNIANSSYAHIVGNGSDYKRSNAHTLDWYGNAWYQGRVTVGADPSGNMDLTTKQYVDGKIANINLGHNHDTEYSKLGHNHDGVYATKTELNNKANSNHTHDDYATKAELDSEFKGYAAKTNTVLETTLSLGRKSGSTVGFRSTALGLEVVASGGNSHAEGSSTTASGEYSHAEGKSTTASGWYSHAEGSSTTARGYYSHAEGDSTTASGEYSHAEGYQTTATGESSHAEGYKTKASGDWSHAEGLSTEAIGNYSHAEGSVTIASSDYQHVQGKYNIKDADDKYLHIVGNGTSNTNRKNAHTLDWNGNAWYQGKVTVGADPTENMDLTTKQYVDRKIDNLDMSHDHDTEYSKLDHNHDGIYATKTYVDTAIDNIDLSEYATKKDTVLETTLSMGRSSSYAVGLKSTALGYDVTASGDYSHAEGYSTFASGKYSHTEGWQTSATAESSHAEGSYTSADGKASHAEGQSTKATGACSHAEGDSTTASGSYSHAEGVNTTASGSWSHAEGNSTTASGSYSHAEGYHTIASSNYQHVQGKYNIEDTSNKYAHIVGNGTSTTRKNAYTLDWSGNAWYQGKITVGTKPTADMDVATKKYVDDAIAALKALLNL